MNCVIPKNYDEVLEWTQTTDVLNMKLKETDLSVWVK